MLLCEVLWSRAGALDLLGSGVGAFLLAATLSLGLVTLVPQEPMIEYNIACTILYYTLI